MAQQSCWTQHPGITTLVILRFIPRTGIPIGISLYRAIKIARLCRVFWSLGFVVRSISGAMIFTESGYAKGTIRWGPSLLYRLDGSYFLGFFWAPKVVWTEPPMEASRSLAA